MDNKDSNIYPDPNTENNLGAPTSTPAGEPVNSQPPVTGIFTEGNAPIQPMASSVIPKGSHSKKPVIITSLILILLAAVGVGCYFLIPKLTSPKKSIAEFEKTMTDLGFTSPGGDASFSSSDGAYAVYYKNKSGSNTVESIALFYDMKSKEALRDLINEEILDSSFYTDESKKVFDGFDWSKDRNEDITCEQAKLHVCMETIHIDNTLLSVMSATSSADSSKSNIEEVVTAMGY